MYLDDLVQTFRSVRHLRSNSGSLLKIRLTNTGPRGLLFLVSAVDSYLLEIVLISPTTDVAENVSLFIYSYWPQAKSILW